MGAFNSILTAAFDALLAPFAGLPPVVGLGVVSAVVGVAMLMVFKHTSNQVRLEETKRQIYACVFEVRLFGDDLGAVLRAQLAILRHNLTYLRLSLVPMLWMIVPLVLLFAQLQFRYGYDGLAPGSTALVKVRLAEDAVVDGGDPGIVSVPETGAAKVVSPPTPSAAGARPASNELQGAALEVPPGLLLDSPALWIPLLRELNWRIRAIREGDHEVTVRVAGEEQSKSVTVSADVVLRSPRRPSASLYEQLLYPVESPLPDGSVIESIEVTYPEARIGFFGWRTHWIVVFFLLTIIVAFAMRKPFDVTI